ncbi:MAG: hypothetical protein J0J06_05005 [Sphingomonas sp.]|uniref:I78 family peptidase inhibitor n=1 Tax=Sphingomonas sp. TaxID=28214 RepID=UPI001AD5EC28|nr:I78 family peptidase inhibitor [Sphingomonas sp.]MBN8814790.1 hypothetical protein [Sphingomonas sp.]
MMKAFPLVALTLLACAPQPPLPGPAGKACSTARLGKLTGKVATVGLANEALKRSGATTSRAIGPGDAVTMDYRADRLNIHLDAKGNVDHFTCG